MKTTKEQLISDLIERTRKNLNDAQRLKSLPLRKLQQRSNPSSWNALECLEHLNLYGDFYLPEINSRLKQTTHKASAEFQSSMLGEYFAKTMLPREKLNKMKTFKEMDTFGSSVELGTIDRFIDQQQKTLELLNLARQANLTRVKTSISISKWIKLRLGDTFRVVVYHNQRHILQAMKAVQN